MRMTETMYRQRIEELLEANTGIQEENEALKEELKDANEYIHWLEGQLGLEKS